MLDRATRSCNDVCSRVQLPFPAMLLDIARLNGLEEIEAEICVVGAGPTGIALAHELSTSHRRTVLVESGDLAPSREFDQLNRGQSVGAPGVGLLEGRSRAFGGTSRQWAGQCLPLNREDLEPRSWVRDRGWPLVTAITKPSG